MTDAPFPLVPVDVDLSDFGFMPLDVRRLRDSRIAAMASGDEFRSAVLLWCAAWHQKPSASLPDDDRELAQLAGYGRVVKEWKKVRAGALHGWIKCSDGRLYHPVIAEKAMEAWAEKQEHAWVRACDRIRKENLKRERAGEPPLSLPPRPLRNSDQGGDGIPAAPSQPSDGIPAENALKGQGQGQGQGEEKEELLPASPPAREPKLTGSKPPHRQNDEAWERFRTVYPKRKGDYEWRTARERFDRAIRDGTDPEAIIAGAARYAAQQRELGHEGTPYVKQASSFMSARTWEEFAATSPPANGAGRPFDPANDADAKLALTSARARLQWSTLKWGPMPNKPGCRINPALLLPSDGDGWAEWGT